MHASHKGLPTQNGILLRPDLSKYVLLYNCSTETKPHFNHIFLGRFTGTAAKKWFPTLSASESTLRSKAQGNDVYVSIHKNKIKDKSNNHKTYNT